MFENVDPCMMRKILIAAVAGAAGGGVGWMAKRGTGATVGLVAGAALGYFLAPCKAEAAEYTTGLLPSKSPLTTMPLQITPGVKPVAPITAPISTVKLPAVQPTPKPVPISVSPVKTPATVQPVAVTSDAKYTVTPPAVSTVVAPTSVYSDILNKLGVTRTSVTQVPATMRCPAGTYWNSTANRCVEYIR